MKYACKSNISRIFVTNEIFVCLPKNDVLDTTIFLISISLIKIWLLY